MRRSAYYLVGISVLWVAASAVGIAQELKLFPGSHLDAKASSEASQATPGKESQVYTTSDSFDKVFAFYKGVYKQDTSMRSTGPKLPSGEQIQWAFFILDGGGKLSTSKYWMKVQHPYVGGTDGKDVRDVTVIQSVRTK
jgi:hypothetical protein